ncbi:hypothetical protein ACFQPC_04485 [Herminiimonas glaciei]|uniref:Uncharacterized protein n=1 Tax=Herminiimonas glaciei TaxID=523788 RepID=A0ABW2I8D6_9BURK
MNVKKSFPLTNGDSLVLIDMLGRAKAATWEDANRNVYRFDPSGRVIWRIASRSEADEKLPYTNIYFGELGELMAYCWDGDEYEINSDTGDIDIGRFLK